MLARGRLYVVGNLRNGINHFFLLVESYALLRIIAETDSLANIPFARVLRHKPHEHFDEGRLPHSILADYTHFFASGERVGESVENHHIVETLFDALGLKNLGADIC